MNFEEFLIIINGNIDRILWEFEISNILKKIGMILNKSDKDLGKNYNWYKDILEISDFIKTKFKNSTSYAIF